MEYLKFRWKKSITDCRFFPKVSSVSICILKSKSLTFESNSPLVNGLDLFSRLSQHHGHVHFSLPAIEGNTHAVAGAVIVHHLGQSLLIVNALAVDGNDQVAANHDWNIAQVSALRSSAQAGAVGRSSGHHLHDQQTVIRRKPHLRRQLRIDKNNANAEGGTAHPSQRNQVIEHSLGRINGD